MRPSVGEQRSVTGSEHSGVGVNRALACLGQGPPAGMYSILASHKQSQLLPGPGNSQLPRNALISGWYRVNIALGTLITTG